MRRTLYYGVSQSTLISAPTVKIYKRGADRIKSGHVWVYRSDVLNADGIRPSALVKVADERGKSLASAFSSTASQRAVRVLPRAPGAASQTPLPHRLPAAVAY